jgi:hypothetical protein
LATTMQKNHQEPTCLSFEHTWTKSQTRAASSSPSSMFWQRHDHRRLNSITAKSVSIASSLV